MTGVLDWVSPRRPEPTDVAEYSVRVREALKEHYALNEIGNGKATETGAYRFDHDPFFNIGNDARYHADILSACQTINGVVIAHDFRIQHLIAAYLQRGADWEASYVRLMARHYGRDGETAARDFIAERRTLDDIAVEFPGIEVAAERAACLITHNPRLSQELADRTGLYCATLPLPFIVPERATQTSPEAGNGQSLLIFGYLGLNRGVDVVLDLMRERPGLTLHIAGEIGPDILQRRVEEMARSGLKIVRHGFLAEAELDALIAKADLVINLRNPTMGEVSGSQLRIFANQGQSVVCNTGWYASLPDEATFKIDPDQLGRELAAIVDNLPARTERAAGMRLAGYNYVAQFHSLTYFAKQFVEFMEDAPRALAHGRRLQLAKHIGQTYHRQRAGAFVSAEFLMDKATRLLGRDAD